MNLFISWSGEKSKAASQILYDWIPKVIQNVEPWLSSEDIDKGSKWFIDISSNLQKANIGIICLTKENIISPWILFEAGALSKTLDKSYVCPYLIDLNPTDLEGPLVQFQAAKSDKNDTKKLLLSINRAISAKNNIMSYFVVFM